MPEISREIISCNFFTLWHFSLKTSKKLLFEESKVILTKTTSAYEIIRLIR